MSTKGKVEIFSRLMEEVQSCDRCARMKGRTRVLSLHNGPLDAQILFVAEAPGRFGADVSAIPLFGDQTGDNFGELLGAAGWTRKKVFATNACLCNPRSEKGNNDKPTPREIRNCSSFLRKTIEIVQPKVVIALGEKALHALAILDEHGCRPPLNKHVGKHLLWFDRLLVPLYHPSPRVCNKKGNRPLDIQKDDYRALRNLL